MEARQLIDIASRPLRPSTITPLCSALTLPSNGVLTLNASTTITLANDAIYQPICNDYSGVITGSGAAGQIHFRDPFYASTLPECYALAATTVIAYMLVIMLLITPRRFLNEGVLVLGRRAFTNSPSGSDACFGIGRRPWLQKAAALTVAISLTIATADTFKVAEAQYNLGYMDAQALQKKVENGTELKIIRIISDTFLWLAQAQTLIRLFPRQREKVIIKWTAFALITLDELFSILNAFAYKGSSRPRSFVDAVPALAYLFQLTLSLLYAAWVVYYSVTKKAFAFYHPQMKNICLVALLSLISVLVPVVFFVTDISKPDVAGWGDYVRWVGAAAASVVVWEWLERIEALERNEKKDGVLGREVFDGDEMLDARPPANFTRKDRLPKISKIIKRRSDEDSGANSDSKGTRWPQFYRILSRFKPQRKSDVESGKSLSQSNHKNSHSPLSLKKPPPAATSVKRADRASADSEFHAINYHPIGEDQSPTTNTLRNSKPILSTDLNGSGESNLVVNNMARVSSVVEEQIDDSDDSASSQRWSPRGLFMKSDNSKDKSQKNNTDFSARKSGHNDSVKSNISNSKRGIRGRVEYLITTQANKHHEKSRRSASTTVLPTTIIPAPPRRINLSATLLELEEGQRSAVSSTFTRASHTTTEPTRNLGHKDIPYSTYQYNEP